MTGRVSEMAQHLIWPDLLDSSCWASGVLVMMPCVVPTALPPGQPGATCWPLLGSRPSYPAISGGTGPPPAKFDVLQHRFEAILGQLAGAALALVLRLSHHAANALLSARPTPAQILTDHRRSMAAAP